MHEFAGYNMPIEYSGIIDEHLTVCQSCGRVRCVAHGWILGKRSQGIGLFAESDIQ